MREHPVLTALKERRSCRVFAEYQMSKEEILTLLDAACYAPAGGNSATWEVVVVTSPDLKEKLAKVALNQEFIKFASTVFVFVGGRVIDVAPAIENLLLAAHALGLEGCWVGSFEKEEVRKILEVPASMPIIALVAVGKPREILTNPGKRHPLEVAHFNKWGKREVSIDLVVQVVREALEKVNEFYEIRNKVLSSEGEGYNLYRLEEKYAAFAFRPLLARIAKLLRELGLFSELASLIEESIKEYSRGRGERLGRTKDINSREVIEWERLYSTKLFPELIKKIAEAILNRARPSA